MPWATDIELDRPDRGENGRLTRAVAELITRYVRSVELGDLELAETVWLTNDEPSFIHPRGHEQGWDEIAERFYRQTMIAPFSERHLAVLDSPRIVAVDEAVALSEFYWQFDATFRSDGSALHTEGRESQVVVFRDGGWRLMHVHYSGRPVAGEREGF